MYRRQMQTQSKIRKPIPTLFENKLISHLVQKVNVNFYNFFVMPGQKKGAGVSAAASCIAHCIHTSTPIREKYPNMHQKQRLTNPFITGRQVRLICRGSKATEPYIICHNDFEHVDFYAASRNVTITAEGLSESFFEDPIRGDNGNNAAAEQERDEGEKENSEEMQLLPLSVSAGRNITRDNFWSSGMLDLKSMTTMNLFMRTYLQLPPSKLSRTLTQKEMTLMLRIRALMVLISGEHLAVEFFLPPN